MNPGAPPPSHPQSRVPDPRPPPHSPLTLALRLVRGGLRGLRRRRLRLQTGSPRRQPPTQAPSLPPSVRAEGAGERLREPWASVPAAPTPPRPTREKGRGSQRDAAAVPKALFHRAERAALPWLQAATAGKAGRTAAGRLSAAPVAPLALGGAAPWLGEPEQGAQEGAGPGSALSSSETNNSSRGERSPSEPPAARARPAPAPGRSRPASLPALLPHMKQLQSRGFWGVGAGVCARVCVSVCV